MTLIIVSDVVVKRRFVGAENAGFIGVFALQPIIDSSSLNT